MRLRDLVKQQGIASFTADDFHFVTSKLSEDPGRLILVGGQAIAVWGVLLDVASPLGPQHTLTEDTDWLGGKLDAKWLCERLGPPSDVDLQFAGDFDSTPSSALAYLKRGNRVLMMDFPANHRGAGEPENRRTGSRSAIAKRELFGDAPFALPRESFCQP